MIKNIAQTMMYVVALALLAMTTDVIWAVIFLIAGAVLAAFESSRFLSATEVGLTCIAIVLAMKGLWIIAIILLAILIIENMAVVLAPIRLYLKQLDYPRGEG